MKMLSKLIFHTQTISMITGSQLFFFQTCGKGVGCFFWPPNCKMLNCTVTIRFVYHKSRSSMNIDISAMVDGWVAFGLNENPAVMVSFIKGMKFLSLCIILRKLIPIYFIRILKAVTNSLSTNLENAAFLLLPFEVTYFLFLYVKHFFLSKTPLEGPLWKQSRTDLLMLSLPF